jgi:hypothetical protein
VFCVLLCAARSAVCCDLIYIDCDLCSVLTHILNKHNTLNTADDSDSKIVIVIYT